MQCFSKFLQSQAQCEALPDSISNKQSMSFKCVKIALLQELQQKNTSTAGWSQAEPVGEAQKSLVTPEGTCQGAACTRLAPGVQRACQLTATQKPEMGNSKQAQGSKAVKKKAPSCFIQTEPVAGEPKDSQKCPRGWDLNLPAQTVCAQIPRSRRHSCMVLGGYLACSATTVLPGVLNTLCFSKMAWPIPRLSPKPGMVLCQPGTLTPHGGGVTKPPAPRGER